MKKKLHLAVLEKFRILVQEAQNHSDRIKKKTGVSGAQLWVLQEVSEQVNITINEIAAKMAMNQSTISTLADQMTQAGYLTRSAAVSDKRKVLVNLTPAGVKLLKKSPEPHKGLMPFILSESSEKELLLLESALSKMILHIPKAHQGFAIEPLPFTR